jgi:trehalose 6-phosphate phosphatase
MRCAMVRTFDIGGDISGDIGELPHAVADFADLLAIVLDRLRSEVQRAPGATVDRKRFSVAVHYRLVDATHRPMVTAVVDELLADYPDQLKITPGKMVYEIQVRSGRYSGS